MAIKKISQFTSGTPTDNDYILFEQNGAGKSAKFSDFSLSYEEIMATTDLSGKVASASALKDIDIIPNYSNTSVIALNQLTSVGGSWTAPCNGFLYVYGVKDNDNITAEITIRINDIVDTEIRYKASGTSSHYSTVFVPIRKGDTVKTQLFTNIYSSGTPKFIPSI